MLLSALFSEFFCLVLELLRLVAIGFSTLVSLSLGCSHRIEMIAVGLSTVLQAARAPKTVTIDRLSLNAFSGANPA